MAEQKSMTPDEYPSKYLGLKVSKAYHPETIELLHKLRGAMIHALTIESQSDLWSIIREIDAVLNADDRKEQIEKLVHMIANQESTIAQMEENLAVVAGKREDERRQATDLRAAAKGLLGAMAAQTLKEISPTAKKVEEARKQLENLLEKEGKRSPTKE